MTNFHIEKDYQIIKERNTQTDILGQKVNRIINSKGYFYHRMNEANKPPYCTLEYQHPEYYFWVVDSKLRLLKAHMEFSLFDICNGLNHKQREEIVRTLGLEWWEEPLHDIYLYLQTLDFSEYYNALMAFKWSAHVGSFPLFEQYRFVQMFDGKLLGWLPIIKERKTEYRWMLLTDETVSREIELCGGQNEVGHNKKTRLAKLLAKLHKDDLFAKKNIRDGQTVVRYQDGVLRYIATMDKVCFSREHANDILLLTTLGDVPNNVKVSDALEIALLYLTGGNLDKLDVLAEFFARIFCIDAQSKYLWYIHGNCKVFLQWLSKLVECKMCGTLFDSNSKDLEKYAAYDEAAKRLIQYNLFPMSTEDFAKLNHSQIKSYINGGEIINTDDPYQVEKSASYYPLVAFVCEGDGIDPKKAFKKLPYQEIDVPYDWSAKDLSTEDYQWLKTCLVAKGLQLIHGIERRQAEQVTPEQLVRQFAADFCEYDPDSRTNCKDFREALLGYKSTLPYEVKLGGSTTLNKLVAGCMGWKYEDDRRNGNQKAFYNVRLNMDKLNAAIEENKARQEQERQARAARDFHEYLNEITELVLWPPVAP